MKVWERNEIDAVVIGGGFYGACIALLMSEYFDKVLIIEKEQDLLQRASMINQARVHTGFHYPRSIITAFRSLINFPRFVLDFRKAIVDDFVKLYAIARCGSKVSAHRFLKMYKMMLAPIEVAPQSFQRLFNKEMIEEVFLVKEVAFDAVKLKDIVREKLEEVSVKILLGTEVERVEESADTGRLRVIIANSNDYFESRHVFNCSYSQINKLLKNSGLPLLPLKHEITEMALVQVPEEIRGIGITVMDGPFFSIMPYPPRKLHSLSHVRYTPHYSWSDLACFVDGHALLRKQQIQTNYPHMIRDAKRYMPILEGTDYVDSLFEIKTVLVRNEIDDGRPILYRPNYGHNNLSVVMGSKIDNIYDILGMMAEAAKSLGIRKKNRRVSFLWGNRQEKSLDSTPPIKYQE